MPDKVWKLIKDPSDDPRLSLCHYELVEQEREYCATCKVVIIEGACFCEWK